jgi:hypothetical protein
MIRLAGRFVVFSAAGITADDWGKRPEVKEESKARQQKVDGGQDGWPLVHQGACMRTEFSTPYSCELWRHQQVAIAVERYLRCEVTHRLLRERWSLGHRDDDPRIERLQQVRLHVDQERKRSLRTGVLVSVDGELGH